jgi:hypothetical protein
LIEYHIIFPAGRSAFSAGFSFAGGKELKELKEVEEAKEIRK